MINEIALARIEQIKIQLNDVEERKFLDQMTDLLEHLLEDNRKLRDSAFESSWDRSPDRMGGQFSQDEIDRSRNGGW